MGGTASKVDGNESGAQKRSADAQAEDNFIAQYIQSISNQEFNRNAYKEALKTSGGTGNPEDAEVAKQALQLYGKLQCGVLLGAYQECKSDFETYRTGHTQGAASTGEDHCSVIHKQFDLCSTATTARTGERLVIQAQTAGLCREAWDAFEQCANESSGSPLPPACMKAQWEMVGCAAMASIPE